MMWLLNLLDVKPGERRAVVVIILAVFVVLNAWWAWSGPELLKMHDQKSRYERKARNNKTLKQDLEQLRGEVSTLKEKTGALVTEAGDMRRSIRHVALGNKIDVLPRQNQRREGREEDFFIEQEFTMDFVSSSTNLVSFLCDMAEKQPLVRVRSLALQPDSRSDPRNLKVDVTFVASYPKPEKEAEGDE